MFDWRCVNKVSRRFLLLLFLRLVFRIPLADIFFFDCLFVNLHRHYRSWISGHRCLQSGCCFTENITCTWIAVSRFAIASQSATLFPGFSPTRPMKQERERPWKTLVTWLQNKINSEGGVLCLTSFLSGLFATFTQWSQQQDRFANPTTTITKTKGNFCLNKTIR